MINNSNQRSPAAFFSIPIAYTYRPTPDLRFLQAESITCRQGLDSHHNVTIPAFFIHPITKELN